MSKDEYGFLTIIGGIILLVLEIITTVYAFSINVSFNDYKSMTFIFSNWGKKPIMDIVISSTRECPVGYSLLSLGNSFGFDSQAQQQIYSWRYSYFCVKYMQVNYQSIYNGNTLAADCKLKGKKSCGYIDTLNSYLCLNSDQLCPLNSFNIIRRNDSYQTDLYKKYDFLDGEHSLITSNQITNGRVFVDIQLFAGRPCAFILDIGIPTISINRKMDNYPNFNDCSNILYRNGLNLDYNTYYELLDNTTYSNIDSYNQFGLGTVSSFPKAFYNRNDFGLYKVPYFGKVNSTSYLINLTFFSMDDVLPEDPMTSFKIKFGVCFLLVSMCVLKLIILIQIFYCQFILFDFIIYFAFSFPLVILSWMHYSKVFSIFAIFNIKNALNCYDKFTSFNILAFQDQATTIISAAGVVGIVSTLIFGGAVFFMLVAILLKCNN
jgi:hypothetical protein